MSERERIIDLGPPLVPAEIDAREAAARRAEETVADLGRLVRWVYMSLARAYKGSMEYGQQPIPQWDGGADQWGKNHNNIWPRLARHILELGVDPTMYMRAQFTYMTRGRVPLPSTFFNDMAVAKYRRYCEEWPQSLRRQYDLALLSARGQIEPCVTSLGWDYRRALRYALSNKVMVQASAMFRYCLATNEGIADVAAENHDQALGDYVFQKNAYDEAWGERIPAELRREAEEIRATMLSY